MTTPTPLIHDCPKRHGSYASIARCEWKGAYWYTGDAYGRYVLLNRCGGKGARTDAPTITVTLYESLEAAVERKNWIDEYKCGHDCHSPHELVRLPESTVPKKKATPMSAPPPKGKHSERFSNCQPLSAYLSLLD